MERLRLSDRGAVALLWCMLFLWGAQLLAQDPSLTNFHITKNSFNPAYAGYSGDFSLSMDNRLQWIKTSNFRQFNTYNLAANVGCERYKLGMAFYANDNVEGEGFLRTTSFGGQLARYWPFDYKSNGSHRRGNSSIIAAGVQFGYSQKRLDWDKLVFSDQLSNSTYQMVRESSIIAPQNNVTDHRMDLGAGVRFMSELGKQKKSSISAGVGVFHVLTNQESFFSESNDVKWPIRLTGHLFTDHQFGRGRASKWGASLGGLYNRQAGVNNFTLMTYASYSSMFKMGLGYRGKDQGLPDAIIIQPTFWGNDMWGKNDWLLTISFEVTTLSSIGQHRSGGTLEFGITILMDNTARCAVSDVDCFYPNKEMKKYSIWGY